MVKENNDQKKIFAVTLQNVYRLVYKIFTFCSVLLYFPMCVDWICNNVDTSYAITFYILEKSN